MAPPRGGPRRQPGDSALTLPGLETLVAFVDDVDAATPAHDAAASLAVFRRFQRIPDFHGRVPGWVLNGARLGAPEARKIGGESDKVNGGPRRAQA